MTQPGEFSPRDRVIFLLHIDAEIEHCLMVQYLYAGYSLGGPQVPEAHRTMVRGWQELILGIAKEEMGHMVTVENALRLLGGPLNFGREDFPWDVPYYPFPFTLEPLTLDSLAKYVYAESPEDWSGPLADEIRQRVDLATPSPHRVAELFKELIPLIKDPHNLPDSAFLTETVTCQANFAEWGRGYHEGERGNETRRHPPKTPNVLVVPLACRDDAVNALTAVSEQGEAPPADAEPLVAGGDGPSHFARFLKIYVEMKAVAHEGWSAARPVAVNPYVSDDPQVDPADASEAPQAQANRIVNPEAVLWASLQNVRYRMLLCYLEHTFLLDGGAVAAGPFSPRGALINAAFGEMYSMRSLSELLMQLPLDETAPLAGNAGPPFQMPYTLNTPTSEANRWRQHLDLLEAARSLIDALARSAPPARQTYLDAMRQADERMVITAQRILRQGQDLALAI